MMSMERICYEEPDSCYSCDACSESDEYIICDKRNTKYQMMFDTQTDSDMEVEYRRAVIRAKNCPNYKRRIIDFKQVCNFE